MRNLRGAIGAVVWEGRWCSGTAHINDDRFFKDGTGRTFRKYWKRAVEASPLDPRFGSERFCGDVDDGVIDLGLDSQINPLLGQKIYFYFI
jgi:hypothetical protein